MGIHDEIREQQKKLKGKSLKEKWEYFWEYYKIQSLIALCAIGFIVSIVHDIATHKDPNFQAAMLNTSYEIFGTNAEEELPALFTEYAALDTNKKECTIDLNSTLNVNYHDSYDVSTQEKIIGLVQTHDLDVLSADEYSFAAFSYNEFFTPLTDLMSEEELKKYEGNIYYVDYEKIKLVNQDSSVVYGEGAQIKNSLANTVDHRDPSSMEDPIPYGIYIDKAPLVSKYKLYETGDAVMGVITTSYRQDLAVSYLESLFEE